MSWIIERFLNVETHYFDVGWPVSSVRVTCFSYSEEEGHGFEICVHDDSQIPGRAPAIPVRTHVSSPHR